MKETLMSALGPVRNKRTPTSIGSDKHSFTMSDAENSNGMQVNASSNNNERQQRNANSFGKGSDSQDSNSGISPKHS